MAVKILVSRLAWWYDAFGVIGKFTLEEMLNVPTAEAYAEETDDCREDRLWHMGRVRYFYELLQRRKWLDPIEVENRVHQYRICSPVTWGGPEILDGHHRFCAAVLARKRRVMADVYGLESTKNWLTGKLRRLPEELR